MLESAAAVIWIPPSDASETFDAASMLTLAPEDASLTESAAVTDTLPVCDVKFSPPDCTSTSIPAAARIFIPPALVMLKSDSDAVMAIDGAPTTIADWFITIDVAVPELSATGPALAPIVTPVTAARLTPAAVEVNVISV